MTEDRGTFTETLKAIESWGGDLDPKGRILLAIGHELHELRHEVSLLRQALSITVHEAPDRPEYECRSCGKVVTSVPEARRHAIEDHSAPNDETTWRDLYHEHTE